MIQIEVNMTRLTIFLLTLSLFLAAQTLPEFNDGQPHGDPPFLVENGWRPLLNGKDLSGWHSRDKASFGWFTTSAVIWNDASAPNRLQGTPGPGDRVINGPNGKTTHLITDEKFGDSELYLEFMLARQSNSGVFMQGLYEVQIFDSYGSTVPLTSGGCGGLYHRWINDKGVGGLPPLVNACRPPGQWQSFHIWFRAPRFDASGRKIENAKFLRVLLNGVLVQNEFEEEGPTRASLEIPEAPLNPIMLQGDHGPITYRNIYIRPLRPIVKK
jgi:hypothetical protein